jgi:hypothetical protein
MVDAKKLRSRVSVVVAVLVLVGIAVWAVYWRTGGDSLARVRTAIVEKYAMERMPDDEGFAMGDGWVTATYLSPQKPPLREQIQKAIFAACSECEVGTYGSEALFVTDAQFVMKGAVPGEGPGYSRFLIVTWEGPLDGNDDGGLVLIEVSAAE